MGVCKITNCRSSSDNVVCNDDLASIVHIRRTKIWCWRIFKELCATGWFLLPVNVIEEFTNFLTLSLRLYGNIYAGEVLLTLIGNDLAHAGGPFTLILAAPLAMIWQGFSVFIGSIQAYVFVTLSMVYIGKKVTTE